MTDISGIGKGLAHVLAEIVIERQSCERRDALLEKFPPGALEFLKIQGLGPKKALRSSSLALSGQDKLTIWNASATSRSCATCRAWARSWKRRYCALLRNIGSGPGVIC